MDRQNFLADQFEAHRSHLRRVAYRMLGAAGEADDAVQEAWLRLSRSEPDGIQNLGGWLTTVVARVCLDMLRTRKSRREEPLGEGEDESQPGELDPEQEALLADSVGLAVLVVLEALAPAERVAFVLHDMFDLPFEEIAPIVGRSPSAARQLASRARRRVRGSAKSADADVDLAGNRQVVDAFLAASRAGDFEGLMAVLDPDVVLNADLTAVQMGGTLQLRGAAAVAGMYKGRAQTARPALVDGALGVVVAPLGKLKLALRLTITNGRIAAIDVIADPERLRDVTISALD